MDIVINSNVQSPLVRTLSATQGKSASFTHHIKDNVPPVSFTKIVLTPDGGSSGSYNRNYKFKIPQYGYLRNFIVKFTGSELGIGTSIMADIYNMTTKLDTALLTGNEIQYSGTATTTGMDYSLKLLFGSNRTAGGANAAPGNQTFVPNGFVPPFEGLVRNGNMDPWATMWGRISGGQNYQVAAGALATMTAYGDARITPYRHTPRYDALNAYGRNIYFISSDTQTNGTTNGYFNETTMGTVVTSGAVDWSVAVPFDGLEWHQIVSVTADRATLVTDNNASFFGDEGDTVSTEGILGGIDFFSATLPTTPYPFAGTGPAPNVQLRNRYLGQRLMSTYDWCSQANLSRHLGALMPITVTLSTHNRVIQTLYPMETLARIYRMPTDQKRRFLSMIRPHITASPSSVGANTWSFTNEGGEVNLIGGTVNTGVTWLRPAGTSGASGSAFNTYRTFDCYFPCFFSFFEDPSMNLDSRFVENLEIDVLVNNYDQIYAPEDLGANIANLGTPTVASAAGTNGTNLVIASRSSRAPLVRYDGWHSSEFRQRVKVVNTTTVAVTALCYYHNFHDSTSQAIRDSNFKPNVPANVLGYNTYSENAVLLTAAQVVQGATINVNLSCNNLTQEIIFLVRRRQRNIAANLQQTHQAFEDFSTTLPIQSVTLTGSGQQLYSATGAECLLTDQWDYPLSSVETGSAITNDSGLYADNHASYYAQSKPTCDGFFAYRIPFSFSTDRTYNSGSVALQTINNPVLSIQFFPIHGWVINDDNLASKLPSIFNLSENMGINSTVQTVFDNDFQLEVYENYWQLIRIDSNTGAVTKSLDL